MKRLNGRVAIACLIAAAGVVVAWRALHRSAQSDVSPIRVLEGLTPTTGLRFERLESGQSIDAYAAAFVAMVEQDAGEAIGAVGAPAPSAVELGVVMERRLRSVLAPETVDWRAIASEEGAEEFPSLEDVPEVVRDRHQRWSEWWSGARFATTGLTVRRLRLDDMRALGEQVRTASRNPIRARYPKIDLARVVEAIVPVMLPKNPGEPADRPAHLGIAYWWDQAEQQWRPGMITVYGSDGTAIIAPPM